MFTRFYLLCLLYFALIYSCSAKHITDIRYLDRYITNYYTNKYFYTNDFYYKEYLTYSNNLKSFLTNKHLYYKYNFMSEVYTYYFFEYNYCYNFSTYKQLTNLNVDISDTTFRNLKRYYITNSLSYRTNFMTNARSRLSYRLNYYLYIYYPSSIFEIYSNAII